MSRITWLVLAAFAVVLAAMLPAAAVSGSGIGAWTPLTGTSTDYKTTMQLPATGFPAASVTSTSRSGQVGVQTGASAWFGENTPVGLEYGSSKNKPYLNLRPKADSAASPSVTTYTFDRPTPQGWAFVLGDVDADKVTVSATTVDGTTATAADLGFQSTFNYCATTPRASTCSGVVAPFDLPSWDAGTRTLTGNTAAEDTTGASGWFQPTASLRTLTLTFTQRSGFPVYQTWFAVKTQSVSGTVGVTSGSCDQSGITAELVDASGAVVHATTTAAGGTYAFDGVAASDGYRVRIKGIPAGCIADGATSKTVDLSSGDDTADFAIRAIVPVPISGHVRDADGNPVGGVTVTITDGAARTTTTDDDGFYLFDTNPPDDYDLTVTPPAGYSTATSPSTVTVGLGDTDPITDRDFVLSARPSISGTVSDADGAKGGVTVVLRDSANAEVARVVTTSDGKYEFPRLPGGDYSVTVPDPPGDYLVPDPKPVTIGRVDETANLALARPGSISGTVTDHDTGDPVAGATITVTGATTTTITTNAAGDYSADGLDSGDYTVVVTAPDGTTVVGAGTQTVTIPPLGKDVGEIDFSVEKTPTPPGDGGGGDGSGGGTGDSDGGSASLPDTGGPPYEIGLLGIALIATGGVLVAAARLRRRT
jgi:hypothetical protein